MNCLACHQGQVAGRVIPGLPNSLFDLETLTEDVRATKQRLGEPLARMEIGSLFMPLGTSRGTTNAVMFGVALMARRDAELNLLPLALPPRMVHHDLDAPAWWHFSKRRHLYIDAFAGKGHRALMQFMLVKENGPEEFREWEDDFRAIYQWLEGLQAPAWPFAVDRSLAATGRAVFNDHCAHCHGTYGTAASYPSASCRSTRSAPIAFATTVCRASTAGPIRQVGSRRTERSRPCSIRKGTWPCRWTAFGQRRRTFTMARCPRSGTCCIRPSGRASGGAATDGYDQDRVGLEFRSFDRLPAEVKTKRQRRQYFDTSAFGKSAEGHRFVDELDEDEKRAVLEYLKTL